MFTEKLTNGRKQHDAPMFCFFQPTLQHFQYAVFKRKSYALGWRCYMGCFPHTVIFGLGNAAPETRTSRSMPYRVQCIHAQRCDFIFSDHLV
jgi:hypothetical protein